jgi:hypothetical protein
MISLVSFLSLLPGALVMAPMTFEAPPTIRNGGACGCGVTRPVQSPDVTSSPFHASSITRRWSSTAWPRVS